MQGKHLICILVIGGLALGCPAVRAEDVIAIEIADTGEILTNAAPAHEFHHEGAEDRLLNRIGLLMGDVDVLLERLHALPPELPRRTPEAIPAGVELAGLIDVALNNNPALAPYRSELAMEAARTRQAGARLDPLLQFMFMNFPISDFQYNRVLISQYQLGWSQQYESYGKRGLKRRIAGLDEDLTQLERAQAELEIIQQVTSLYYNMASTQARLTVLDDNSSLLELLIELAERKYSLGRTPQALVLQAQTNLSQLEEQRINLEAMLDSQTEMLLGLLGHPTENVTDGLKLVVSYPIPLAVEFDVDELLAETLERRPDLQHLATLRNQQQYTIDLARRNYHPDYMVSASYELRQNDSNMMSAGISFPLFTHKAERQDAAVQEAYAALDVTDSNAAMLENILATQLGSLKVELSRIYRLSSLYRDGLVPQARLTLDSTIAGYSANQVDLADLLLAQQALLSYELELEQLYLDYLAALSELQVITVGSFDPAPFVVAELGASQDVASSLAPQINRAIDSADSDQQPPVSDAAAVAVQAEQPVPLIEPGFLTMLSLPPATPESPAAPDTEPVAEDEVEDQSAAEPGTGFYEPYTPSGEE